jgi:hypothetical protein
MRHTFLLVFFAVSPAFAGADPLTAKVNTDDADRFAAVFEAAEGAPSAADLQAGYLDAGSRGISVFTPHRIKSADNLAAAVAARPDEYRKAIEVCLPIAKATSGELRAVYLALDGLLGSPELPEIYVVFGAGNSGGTADDGAQVLGLEVICRGDKDETAIRDVFRNFYAHETVHTLQPQDVEQAFDDEPLLTQVLMEGTADFVAWLVTGMPPNEERALWAKAREKEIWKAFQKDRKALDKIAPDKRFDKGSPLYRWVANVGSPPEGWPGELGYWLGMQIAKAYFEKAADKREAVQELIACHDPAAILQRSGYLEGFK